MFDWSFAPVAIALVAKPCTWLSQESISFPADENYLFYAFSFLWQSSLYKIGLIIFQVFKQTLMLFE